MPEGIVRLVGAGPGNPGLLTIRAKELLESCHALVFDSLIHPAVLALVSPDCELIYVGKKSGGLTVHQETIQRTLVEKAKEGKEVVRLKGGDPFVFGRGGEEALFLRENGIAFEVVPGVTAASGAAAFSGTPLTQRKSNSTVVFVTGHEDPEKDTSMVDWKQLPKENSSLCIYMGVGNLSRIIGELLEADFDPNTPVVCVEWATLGRQRVCRSRLNTVVDDAKGFCLNSPAVIMVGGNATMGEKISWFEDQPLQGRRFVVTRSKGQASELSEMLERQGAEVLGLPLISISKHVDEETRTDVFAEIASYDWIVFSSPNGVRYFFDAFFETFDDIRSLGFLRIAAVGKATASEIKKYYVTTDLIPKEANAESLAEALVETESLDSSKVLIVTGNLGRDVLRSKLEEARAIVDRFEVYRTEPANLSDDPAAKELRSQGADAIIFTSSSGVKSFVDQAKDLALEEGANRPKTVSIGPITSATMSKSGMPTDFEAKEASLDSLVEVIKQEFGKASQ